MRTRNVRRKRWERHLRRIVKAGHGQFDVTCSVLLVTWGPGAARFFSQELRRLENRAKTLRNRRTEKSWKEFDRVHREHLRQTRIDEYNRDPGAWWLREALQNETNFAYYCEHMERKWGKPHGWWYQKQREAEVNRRMVAAYYASDYYQRYKSRREDALRGDE